jgi:hypothetical protein
MSPQPAVEPRFFFRAYAIPLAARIRRPRDFHITPQAATTLPITGGRVEAQLGRQSLEDIFTFEEAYSSVDGDYENPAEALKFTHGNHAQNKLPTKTVVRCGLRGLSVVIKGKSTQHRLTADNIELQITSRGRQPGVKGNSICIDKASIDGLALDGHRLSLDLRHQLFCENDTKDKLCKAYQDEAFLREHRHMFLDPGPGVATYAKATGNARAMPETDGLIACTVLHRAEWAGNTHPEAKIEGNKIIFPDFGVIYLAESTITGRSRRVTLLRMQFGSPDGGEGSGGEGEGNGIEWPPSDQGGGGEP